MKEGEGKTRDINNVHTLYMLNVPYATDPGDHATDGEKHNSKLGFKIIFIHVEGTIELFI